MGPTYHDGIAFYENRPTVAYEELGELSTELRSAWITQTQLKTLKDLKKAMAAQASQMGGDAIISFEYGQKCVGFWQSLFEIDDVIWRGSGTVVRLRSRDRHRF